jgi:hypothetical protein
MFAAAVVARHRSDRGVRLRRERHGTLSPRPSAALFAFCLVALQWQCCSQVFRPARKPESPHETYTGGYCTSSKILNIGRYIEITTRPTMQPTPIIMSGSMIEVSDFSIVATSSS